MNKSEIFKAAHEATRFEIRTRKPHMSTYEMTYAQLFSMFLKKQYSEVKVTVTVSISYDNKKTREIIKKNGGVWNATAKTWAVSIAKKNLHLVAQYIVSDTKTVAPLAKKTNCDYAHNYFYNEAAGRGNE